MTREIFFSVPDMDCGGCVRAITTAVHELDAHATVTADLTTKRVTISTTSPADFTQAIEAAGFTATSVPD